MRTVPISVAKAKLNELVDEAVSTHEHVTITKNGTPAAVLLSADEWESMQETLFWSAQPMIREDIAEAERAYAAGDTLGEEDVRARLGVPKRP
ncbi:MAG: type II toxin-antitoxin system Phd/YefM family antitoxin [Dermatophilaceae bacterium]